MKLSSAFLKSEESIICGDMNAHSKVWGSNTSNVTGKELLEELENYPSHTILNTGKPTTKRGGAIDLALATNSVTISH